MATGGYNSSSSNSIESSDNSSLEASVYTSCDTSEDECMNGHNGIGDSGGCKTFTSLKEVRFKI